MKTWIWWLIGIVVVVGAAYYYFYPGFKSITGSGNIITEEREVTGFDSIHLSGSGEVIISQGSDESLIIETDDNLIDKIKSEVRGSTLNLSYEPGIGIISPTKLVFRVGLKDIAGVNISGSGEVNASNITTSDLQTKVSGSGNIDLSGRATNQDINISGSGKYLAGDLESETAKITVSGSGKATLWVTKDLDISISGSGDVDYYGSPKLEQNISGSGNLKSLGDK
jgi:hypothetical protein